MRGEMASGSGTAGLTADASLTAETFATIRRLCCEHAQMWVKRASEPSTVTCTVYRSGLYYLNCGRWPAS